MNTYGVILIVWLALGAGFRVSRDLTTSGIIAELLRISIMTWLIFQI